MSWQKPARIAVALIGIASALAVYLTMGERRAAPAPQPVQRVDEDATIEISGSLLERFAGLQKDFEVRPDRFSYYADGSIKLIGDPKKPWIIVHKGENRTFRIAAAEAKVSKDENYFELTGPVRLEDSDGFWLETATATVNRTDSIAHIPGPARFGKGRMSGTGVGLSYDERRQVLLIAQQAQVRTVDEAGKTVMEFTSQTAMLDRLQHYLTLDTSVHVVRNEQIIDADQANGRLGPNNDVVRLVELHGNSRVTGGPPIEAMSARDINLDYTDDGKTLEAVKMVGAASAALAGAAGRAGRKFAGETIDLSLAADGAVTMASARENVRLELPAGGETPARTIAAYALDGTGQPGKGLTDVTFTRDVRFSEQPLRLQGTKTENQGGERIARAQKLEASLADDAVTAAVFTGDVTFEENGLKACAERADYQPQKNTLGLTGATKAGNPMVAEEQVAIEGKTIGVALDSRDMTARGDVTMWMRSPAVTRCKPSTQRGAAEQGAKKMPGLLESDAPVTIVGAQALDYNSRTGHAVYSGGRTTLEQGGQTSIAGERLVIDQSKGDLQVTGRAVSTLMLDKKKTTGRAHEIRYSDERRLITYSSAAKTADTEVSLTSAADSRLNAGNIEIALAAKDNTLDRMKAVRNVRAVEGVNTVSGGATLDYTAVSGEYVVKADGTTPVLIIQRDGDVCRQHSGNSVTFYKDKERSIVIDGQQTRHAATAPSKSACTAPAR